MKHVLEQLGEMGLVPVVVLKDAADALPLGQALLEGGLSCAEITFRTAAAEESIRALTSALPEMLVGAGTVLTVAQAQTAVAAGAKFVVTPGFDATVVDWCLANGVPITPGVMTPTEINMALGKGLAVLKFFPTGGINAVNLADYLRLPVVHACGGSWLVAYQLIANGEFSRIAQLTAEAVAIVKQCR